MSDIAIASRGVRKAFGPDDRILEGADLEVDTGEILLLMGPNGVGKTVLLSCLAGSERPTAGTVEVFGEPAHERDGGDVGFLLQNSVAVDTLTGRENVRFYAGVHPTFTDRWQRYVAELGIEDDLGKLVKHYSEGMKRKLEFSLTLSGESSIYLLDEPTAGVDLTNIQRFHDVILEQYERGKTFVISSHRPMDATIADRIAFMPDGTISAVGRPEDLLEGVPRVVRVAGREAMTAAQEYVVGGQLFPLGGEARGFLADEHTIANLEAAIADRDGTQHAAVTTVEPNYTDLFNYYVHVRNDYEDAHSSGDHLTTHRNPDQ